MHFVYQVDLVAAPSRHVLGIFQQLSGVIDPSTGGSIHLNEINKAILFYLNANRTLAARGGTHALFAIQALGQNSRNGCFADATGPGEQIGVMQTIVIEGMG